MADFDVTRLLRRTGILDAYDAKQARVAEDSLPVEARTYLNPSNQRLLDIQDRYARTMADALQHSQWTRDYILREISLRAFRRDSAYMWQYRDNLPINYLCTYYFLKQSVERDLLEQCTEDDLFGVYSVTVDSECVTRDRLDSVCELAFLRRTLGLKRDSSLTVLDIGSGYGRFAYRMAQCFPSINVLCADVIPESSFLCEYYLRYRNLGGVAQMVEFPELVERLKTTSVDIAVAINSLSECSSSAIAWWLNLLRTCGADYLFLVPHAAHDGGRSILSRETEFKMPLDVTQLLTSYGYREIACEPKYHDPLMQKFGVSPTYYHLFERQSLKGQSE